MPFSIRANEVLDALFSCQFFKSVFATPIPASHVLNRSSSTRAGPSLMFSDWPQRWAQGYNTSFGLNSG